jgi:preprotein translocase subunit SecE
MGKEKDVALNGFWREMFQFGLYKRNQGRITRQVTFAALALAILLASWRISESFGATSFTRYMLPSIIVVVGLWLCFRLVNMPKFADFLIGVEGEMSKVTWPTRMELFRGSVVVIVTLVALAFMLMVFDLVWSFLLKGLGI